MIATADTMFGPGFVWLVGHKRDNQDKRPQLRLLNTYLAGSPYVGAHWRKQSVDMNTMDNFVNPREDAPGWAQRNEKQFPTYGLQNSNLQYANRSATFAEKSGKSIVPGIAMIEPLLCVNTWPHIYLEQFGVAGKRQYLEAWWDSIDWPTVYGSYERAYPGRR